MHTLEEIRNKFNEKRGELLQIKKTISKTKKRLEEVQEEIKHIKEAQVIIQIVAVQTQSQLESELNELVSFAMYDIFRDDAFELKIEFNIKNGRTDATPTFVERGHSRKPGYGTGYGPLDVGSLFLRPTLWSLETNLKRPIFLFDEPLRHLNDKTGTLHRRACNILRKLAEEGIHGHKLQIIIVTQNNYLCDAGDRVFYIDQKDGESLIADIIDK
jgi:hypothetical protein